MVHLLKWRSHATKVANLAILTAFMFLWSCDQHPTVAPEAQDSSFHQKSNVSTVLKANPVTPVKKSNLGHSLDGVSKSKTIKADKGGTVKNHGNAIFVPAGAIDEDKTFSITILSSDFMDLEFKPDGAFITPVELTISYEGADLSGISEDDLTIAWYDPDSSQYYDVGGTIDKKKKHLKVWVSHFTRYSLSVR